MAVPMQGGTVIVRRVVTGHDGNGTAIFTSDSVRELTPLVYQVLWGSEEAETFPNDGTEPAWSSNYPAVGGYRFSMIEIPAGYDPESNPPSKRVLTAEQRTRRQEQSRGSHQAEAGMHWTETVDFIIMLSGELIHELEGGEQTVLRAGDTLIQNGAVHRWRNATDKPARFAFVMVGAHDRSGRQPIEASGGLTGPNR